MDSALPGATIDIADEVWTVGIFTRFHAGNLLHPPPPNYYQGISTGFQLMVMM